MNLNLAHGKWTFLVERVIIIVYYSNCCYYPCFYDSRFFVSDSLSGFISGFKYCILLTPNSSIEIKKPILGKRNTNNSNNMPKLSKRQLHSRKNFLSLQKLMDDNVRYQKKRAVVEIADDAEDRTAQLEWNLLIHELSGSESDEERMIYSQIFMMLTLPWRSR